MKTTITSKHIPIWRNTSLDNLIIDINGILYEEEWKSANGFEGFYEVSNFCRIKSLSRIDCRGQKRLLKIMLQNYDSDGYLIINMFKNGISFILKAHRIGAIAFIKNPNKFPAVNHLDGNKTNNWVGNLEWVTNRNNILHAVETGLRNFVGSENPSSKLTNKEAILIFNSKESYKNISKKFGISFSAIGHIKTGYTWSEITGKINSRK